jgi:hypothetical protein
MLLKTTITFIFIFSFVCLGGNIFLLLTPGLAFGEKDIGHPAISEYLSLTGQGKLWNRKIISERKQTFYGNSLPVRRTDKESIFIGLNIFLSANPTIPKLFRNCVLYYIKMASDTETSIL